MNVNNISCRQSLALSLDTTLSNSSFSCNEVPQHSLILFELELVIPLILKRTVLILKVHSLAQRRVLQVLSLPDSLLCSVYSLGTMIPPIPPDLLQDTGSIMCLFCLLHLALVKLLYRLVPQPCYCSNVDHTFKP
jgi:hypothetical protein